MAQTSGAWHLPCLTRPKHRTSTARLSRRPHLCDLDASESTANFTFTPDEQEFKCQLAPDLFAPVNNAWGRSGWTTMTLGPASEDDLRAALAMAHAHAVGKPKCSRNRLPSTCSLHVRQNI